MTNYNHLCKEQRDTIQLYINEGRSFTFIGDCIHVDRTTISKEVRRNRYVKSAFFPPFNTTGIKRAVKACPKLSRPPYVCNNCKIKNGCTYNHIYYNSSEAQKHYEETLVNARIGVDISPEDVNYINKNIVPLIKDKRQSVNQIFINHPDLLYFSKTTFYKYVENGILNLANIDLPRKVRYKARKKNNTINKRDIAILKGRYYEDYSSRIATDSKLHIWQLDTVIGKQEDNKVLMTFLLVETNFMIIRLLDKKTMENVSNAFEQLKLDLGTALYKKLINVILTDNGIEFYNPYAMEMDYNTGEIISSLYYCHPNSPHEKAELEKNHEYIRYVLPKGTSFENLNEEKVKRLEDNINNVPREILGNVSPYQLTNEKYPELIEALNSQFIEPDEVNLSSTITGDNHEIK